MGESSDGEGADGNKSGSAYAASGRSGVTGTNSVEPGSGAGNHRRELSRRTRGRRRFGNSWDVK